VLGQPFLTWTSSGFSFTPDQTYFNEPPDQPVAHPTAFIAVGVLSPV
jgi:hypothetical protein